ncbi:hypothetical protein AZ09_11995 [Acetobacter aceti 1023]|nr:hypothetical protein AZ09_11995 [Acetobacter aceti 1023]
MRPKEVFAQLCVSRCTTSCVSVLYAPSFLLRDVLKADANHALRVGADARFGPLSIQPRSVQKRYGF